jgi:hypothetical protein
LLITFSLVLDIFVYIFAAKYFFQQISIYLFQMSGKMRLYARSANGIYPVENKHIITVFSLTRLPATVTTSPEIPVILWGSARVSPGASGLLIVVKSGK